MPSLVGWIQQLGFLVVVAALTQILLPASEIRKTARLVIGLVIILALVEPAVEWLAGGAASWQWDERSGAAASLAGARYIEEGQRLREASLSGVEAAWRDQAERELAAFLSLVPGVDGAGVELEMGDGRVRRVAVRLVAGELDGGEAGRRAAEERVRRLAGAMLAGAGQAEVEIVWDVRATSDDPAGR